MPIYEWKCPVCKTKMDLLQNVNNKHAPECPNCEVTMIENLNPVGFRMKGTAGSHRLVKQEAFENDWGND